MTNIFLHSIVLKKKLIFHKKKKNKTHFNCNQWEILVVIRITSSFVLSILELLRPSCIDLDFRYKHDRVRSLI